MIVDRPFFFGIRDELTDTILFMGSVGDPSSCVYSNPRAKRMGFGSSRYLDGIDRDAFLGKSLFAGGFSDPNNNPAVLYRQVQAFTEVRDYTSAEKILLRLVKMAEKANGSDAIETLNDSRELVILN